MIPVIQSIWLNIKWFLHLPQCQEEEVATYSSACFGHFLPWLQAAQHICRIKPGNSVDRTSAHVSIGIQLIDHQCHVSLEKKDTPISIIKILQQPISQGKQPFLPFIELPNPMQHPWWEASKLSATQDIVCISWDCKVYHCIPTGQPLDLSLSQMRQLSSSPSYFFMNHLNVILLSMPTSSKQCLFFRYPHQNPTCIFLLLLHATVHNQLEFSQ
jgi:hypothetical protein